MKRVISIALALCLCLICFVGCGEKTYDGWEFVTTGEVSYQISKDWRTREQPGNTESYITFEYYVDENHSYGMSYIKPDDLSEKNKIPSSKQWLYKRNCPTTPNHRITCRILSLKT